MEFDIKDIKSWSNRKDVKIGAEGYFCHDINKLRNNENEYIKPVKSTLVAIRDNYATCFQIDNGRDGDNVFPFFLPLDAVKEDKLEKKYRSFKDLYEFYQFLSFNSRITKEDFTPNMLLGLCFKYREKKAPRFAHTIVINRIDFDLADDPCEPGIDGRNLELWFDFSEIMNDDGEWQPFGVQIND